MRSKTLLRIICTAMTLVMLCGCGAQSVAPQTAEPTSSQETAKTMSCEEITTHFFDMSDDNRDTTPLYFKNGNRQIPYMNIETIRELLTVMNSLDSLPTSNETVPYELEVKTDGPIVVLKRENEYDMEIDFDKDTIRFTDYEMFMIAPYKITTTDILSATGYDEEGRPSLFQRVKEDSYDRYGEEWTLNLANYNIDMIYEDGDYFIPMQTVADVLLPGYYLLFNTEELFITSSSEAYQYRSTEESELMEGYYSVSVGERSQELIDYTYNELCFAMDNFYGLKEKHDIDTFDNLFQRIEVNGYSMKQMLNSTNSKNAEIALKQLMLRDLDDNHSSYLLPSVYTGKESIYDINVNRGISNREYDNLYEIFSSARETEYPDGVPGYEEVGNTAFITFDGFSGISSEADLYENFPTAEDTETIPLIIYAHSRITREGSPIKNVVLDLSCNSGGDVDTAIAVCAWFIGETYLYIDYPNTGAASCTAYRFDMNLDREFDEKDTLNGKNLYCLISPLSFSCGNLVPNVLSASHRVTLVGQTSGGGTCCVLPMTTASGSMFQTSGSIDICVIKNGAYYDVDLGATPDIPLTQVQNYYDREGLNKYLNSLH